MRLATTALRYRILLASRLIRPIAFQIISICDSDELPDAPYDQFPHQSRDLPQIGLIATVFGFVERTASGQVEIPKAREAYENALGQWKDAMKRASKARFEFNNCERDEADKWRDDYNAAVQEGNLYRDQTVDRAVDLYELTQEEDLGILIEFMLKFNLENGRFEKNYNMCKRMLDVEPNSPDLMDLLINCCMKTDRYEEALELGKQIAENSGATDEIVAERLELVESFVETWQEEKQLRAAEAESDNLPRVKLETSKGSIVVELFEDQAPLAVNNFVSLVEDGFYDGKTFHRVLAGFMAQTGCPVGNGTGGAGYVFPDEFGLENARKHYRGVLSMANAGPNTQSSQFFITSTAAPFLNGKHTVFGRVLEGIDVVERLNITHTKPEKQGEKEKALDGVEPDSIIKATVLRKRDHEYKPTKL